MDFLFPESLREVEAVMAPSTRGPRQAMMGGLRLQS